MFCRSARLCPLFSPTVEHLEPLRLPATIALFGPTVITAANNAQFGYALPGMTFHAGYSLDRSFGYLGLYQLTYTLSQGVSTLYPDTFYDSSVGREVDGPIVKTVTYSNPDGSPAIGPIDNYVNFTAAKDPGTYGIDVSGIAWVNAPNPSGYGTIQTRVPVQGGLTLKVEAPEVDFHVVGQPAQFGTASSYGINDFDGIGFFSSPGSTTAGFTYYATVNNTTHYDAAVGFIQLARLYRSATYEGQPTVTRTFNPQGTLWDGVASNSTAVWYQNTNGFGYWKVPKGDTLDLSNNLENNSNVGDSPYHFCAAQTAPANLLQSITVNDLFWTSVAVMGGQNPNNGLLLGGIPIALSTASWSFGGSKTTTADTVLKVLDPGQWSTGTLTPSGPDVKYYPGDNVIQYLQWTGNGPAQLAAFTSQGAAGCIGGLGASLLRSGVAIAGARDCLSGRKSVPSSGTTAGLAASIRLSIDPNRSLFFVIPAGSGDSAPSLKPPLRRKTS